MCNENKTKYVYSVPAGMTIKTVFNLYADTARECPRKRIAISLNDIVLEIDGKTPLSTLEERYAEYQALRRENPEFQGDVMPGEQIIMRGENDILTDRYHFKPRFS